MRGQHIALPPGYFPAQRTGTQLGLGRPKDTPGTTSARDSEEKGCFCLDLNQVPLTWEFNVSKGKCKLLAVE